MTPDTATQQALAVLREAGLDRYVQDIRSETGRYRFEQHGHVIWDEPAAIFTRVTVSESASPQVIEQIQNALWAQDGVEGGSWHPETPLLISVVRWP